MMEHGEGDPIGEAKEREMRKWSRHEQHEHMELVAELKAKDSPRRIYGYENIKRHCQRAKPDHTDASGSIAGQAHEGTREQQRRLRQKAKREGKHG